MEDKITIKNYDNKNSVYESAVLDLYSTIDVDIGDGPIKKVNTGICISLPENFYVSIKDKSSLASKGLSTLGGVIINKNYAKEIIVLMYSLTEPIKIKKGQKIAKLIISNKKVESSEHIKEYNEHIKSIIDSLESTKDIYSICLYLTNIKMIFSR